jgi:hypothetical protein
VVSPVHTISQAVPELTSDADLSVPGYKWV